MKIQTFTPDKLQQVVDLFHQSVHAIDSTLYTSAQKEAWAPSPPNYQRWAARLNVKKPFIALINNSVVGFIELDSDGHIDCTYTHHDYQRQGIASALFEHVLQEAKSNKLTHLYVEASLVARPFFENRGFSLIRTNSIERDGVTLINFTLKRNLYPEQI